MGSYIKIRVSDTGHGMSQEIREHIFEPYFTTKKKGVGTGLGLSVVHGIVKNHGGYITVQSEPGKGTTFDILLPRIDDAIIPLEEHSGPVPKGHERILLVDDERMLLDMWKQMLERLGYEIQAETSSLGALRTFRDNPYGFDLVITDMTMPKMTGDALAKEMIHIRQDIPIILCTGFSEMITEEKAKSIGIQEFVMKPYTVHDLARRIRKVLDNT